VEALKTQEEKMVVKLKGNLSMKRICMPSKEFKEDQNNKDNILTE